MNEKASPVPESNERVADLRLEIANLEAENEALRKCVTALHRRAQHVESLASAYHAERSKRNRERAYLEDVRNRQNHWWAKQLEKAHERARVEREALEKVANRSFWSKLFG